MPKNIRRFATAAILTATLLATARPGNAASYFVDYAGGADANNGTSTNAAWKHCPGDPSATGTPASTNLAAGDTVFFKGGVTYVLTAAFSPGGNTPGIALNWAGASGNPIVYDGNSA